MKKALFAILPLILTAFPVFASADSVTPNTVDCSNPTGNIIVSHGGGSFRLAYSDNGDVIRATRTTASSDVTLTEADWCNGGYTNGYVPQNGETWHIIFVNSAAGLVSPCRTSNGSTTRQDCEADTANWLSSQAITMQGAQPQTFTLSWDFSSHGTMDGQASGSTVYNIGESATYGVCVEAGYHMLSFLVDGSPVSFSLTQGIMCRSGAANAIAVHVFDNISADHTVSATYDVDPPIPPEIPHFGILTSSSSGSFLDGVGASSGVNFTGLAEIGGAAGGLGAAFWLARKLMGG